MAEIPLIVCNIQRGGPSTGLPTNVEQSDLHQAIFGSHGDSPRVVLAASTVEDCFYIAIEAARIARKYSTPVFILSDTSLATRIEAITPPDEIYLAAAARLALTSAAEIQTALVETFVFKGFADATPIYRVQQRHRTRTIADTYILYLDLKGFGKIMDADPGSTTVERLLDALDTVTHETALEFDGTIRFNLGDSYCITFTDAGQAIAGAERLSRSWATKHQELFGCAISIGLHRGTIYTFRSFLYGRDVWIASRLQDTSAKLLESGENGVFVTGLVRDALFGTPWHNRLHAVELNPLRVFLAEIAIYRLLDAPDYAERISPGPEP